MSEFSVIGSLLSSSKCALLGEGLLLTSLYIKFLNYEWYRESYMAYPTIIGIPSSSLPVPVILT